MKSVDSRRPWRRSSIVTMRTMATSISLRIFVVATTLLLLLLLNNGRVLCFSVVQSHQRGTWSWSSHGAATSTETTSVETEATTARILENMQQEHDAEVRNGFHVWGRSSSASGRSGDTRKRIWKDDDLFVARSIGVGNAGPSEFKLKNGDKIFQTKQPVVSKKECKALITEAREVIAKGLEEEGMFDFQNTTRPTNSQLGEARISQMPRAKKWLRGHGQGQEGGGGGGGALHERFFPILESRFGIPATELTLNDALIIGYGYFDDGKMGCRSQPVHRDSDLLSLNVALSSPQDGDFDPNTGGGTYFEALPAESSVIKTDQGHLICHSGGAQHAGRGLLSGGGQQQRWILVLFCVAEKEPQLARRCHARGMMERQEEKGNNLQAAEDAFRAGLSVAPRDHLLLSSFGGVQMAKGNERLARSYLSAAASSYRHCQKANLGLGRMMMLAGPGGTCRRPRAALRRFDAVLDYLNERDDLEPNAWMPLKAMGWDARVHGSHAAILCVLEARKAGVVDFDSKTHLQRAVERLNVALTAVPGDERILGMLAKAEELLSEEEEKERI